MLLGFAGLPVSIEKEERHVDREGLLGIAAYRITRPIPCDGDLGKPAWEAGTFSPAFVTTEQRPAPAEVVVKALFDEENLYIGFLCAERNMSALKAQARIGPELLQEYYARNPGRFRFTFPLWEGCDDSVAAFIQPDETRPDTYHFGLNSRGVRFGVKVLESRRKPTHVCEAGWQAATRLHEGYWSAELKIPFKTLGAADVCTTKWRVNFHRFFRDDLLEPASWRYSLLGWADAFYVPEKFGRMTFESP